VGFKEGEQPRLADILSPTTVTCSAQTIAPSCQLRDVGAVPGDCTDATIWPKPRTPMGENRLLGKHPSTRTSGLSPS